MACTWLAAAAGFVARVAFAPRPTTATRGRPLACAEDPASVVSAQLRALQSGEAASLRVCHGFMSPAYHERADALERFTEWFDSPVYESLLRCSSRAVLSSPPSPTPQPHPEQVQLLEDPRRRGDERGDAGEPFCLDPNPNRNRNRKRKRDPNRNRNRNRNRNPDPNPSPNSGPLLRYLLTTVDDGRDAAVWGWR